MEKIYNRIINSGVLNFHIRNNFDNTIPKENNISNNNTSDDGHTFHFPNKQTSLRFYNKK